jgi:hypothetical protein
MILFIYQLFMSYKLTKRDLINDIIHYHLKNGETYDNNTIFNLSKKKLFEYIILNNIPHITPDILKEEIIETEKFNYYYETIFHNFKKYKNINYSDIKDLSFNSNSNSLNDIIISNNLKFDNDINETKELIEQLLFNINQYCISTNTLNTIEFKTLPDITNFLSSISNIHK